MNINEILNQLDYLFKSQQIEKVEEFLLFNVALAKQQCDHSTLITLLNELMGYYRDVTKYDASIKVCQEAMELLNSLGMQGTIPYATTLQNVANALRAAGQLDASMQYYNQVFRIYEEQLDKEDMRYASLHNNLSLLYQEMGEYEASCKELESALAIVVKKPHARIEVATTHANIALSLIQLNKLEGAKNHLIEAFKIYNIDVQKNHHYSAAVAAMGDVCYMEENYMEAAYYYQIAMKELEVNVGRIESYYQVDEKYKLVIDKLGCDYNTDHGYENGLELCEQFYRQHGEKQFQNNCADIYLKLSFGLVGNGSEAHGFDDVYSRDHDWGPGFCVWADEEVISEHRDKLVNVYNQLPKVYKGVVRNETTQAMGRIGVMDSKSFYQSLLETDKECCPGMDLSNIEEYNLYAATNGRVFKFGEGLFKQLREEFLSYYEKDEHIKRLAKAVHNMSQSGQYNFPRMMRRGDYVSASLIFHTFIESTMDVCYLLNRTYAPYTKWKFKGMSRFTKLVDIKTYLEILTEQGAGSPKAQNIIEVISSRVLEELIEQGYTSKGTDFLDYHMENIMSGKDFKDEDPQVSNSEKEESTCNLRKRSVKTPDSPELPQHITQQKNALVNAIVLMEWEQFDKVENTGGCRADCQDNWETFYVMRKSQFLAWSDELLYSYQKDFLQANLAGWNMVTEKYGRMMISTDPEEYKLLEPHFPKMSEERLAIIEEICKIQVAWMEEFSQKCPNVTKGARNIHTCEDTTFATSYETYLRGELKTYSDRTFKLYGKFIAEKSRQGVNLAYEIITNTALLYGCEDVYQLEELMSK